MVAINHALTGGLVAVAISNPWPGLPAALLSHFIIDALPHWNYQIPRGPKLRPIVIGIDMIASFLAIVLFAIALDLEFWLFVTGGMLGMLPDTMWLPYILYNKSSPRDKNTPLHILRRFHIWIQWSESSKGIFVEAAWFSFVFGLTTKLT